MHQPGDDRDGTRRAVGAHAGAPTWSDGAGSRQGVGAGVSTTSQER